MIVVDNGLDGMVHQFQEADFKERYHSTLWGQDHLILDLNYFIIKNLNSMKSCHAMFS